MPSVGDYIKASDFSAISGILGTQVFTSSAIAVVPDGATKAILTGCGGGGGGCTQSITRMSGHGGRGGVAISYPMPVSAGTIIPITIGTGGKANGGAIGGQGGNTYFGSYMILGGGDGGYVTDDDGSVFTGTNGASVSSSSPSPEIYGTKPIGDLGTLELIPITYFGNYGCGGHTGFRGSAAEDGGPGLLIVTWAK